MIKIVKIPGKVNLYSLILQVNNPYQEVSTLLPRSGRTPLPRSKDTIDNTIDTYNKYSSFKKPKPYFRGNEMRRSLDKWWVIEQGEWKEFAGLEKDIIWK